MWLYKMKCQRNWLGEDGGVCWDRESTPAERGMCVSHYVIISVPLLLLLLEQKPGASCAQESHFKAIHHHQSCCFRAGIEASSARLPKKKRSWHLVILND